MLIPALARIPRRAFAQLYVSRAQAQADTIIGFYNHPPLLFISYHQTRERNIFGNYVIYNPIDY